MGEIREYWANVYAIEGRCWAGEGHETRIGAEAVGIWRKGPRIAPPTIARIHVRLKPEGAPKRYANPHDRWCWENNPKRAAALDELFAMDLPFERANEGGGDTA